MKSKKLTCITAMIVFVALAIPFQLTANSRLATPSQASAPWAATTVLLRASTTEAKWSASRKRPTQTPTASAR